MGDSKGDDDARIGDVDSHRGSAGLRKGQVAFKVLRSDSGGVVPVSFGALPWCYQKTLGLSVMLKASFSLENGPMRPRNPEPMYSRDTAWANGTAILAASDMVPRRPLVDVTVAGKAHAPAERQRQRVNIRFALMQGGLVLFDRSEDLAVGTMSPFAARAALHESRRSLLGAEARFDAQGVLEVPGNMPWSYYQAAPEEQCIESLSSDAVMVLEGLHPRHQKIRATLPDVWAAGSIFGLDERAPHEGCTLTLRADTVVLDAERLICSVVWRAELGLSDVSILSRLTVVAGVAISGQPVTAPTHLGAGQHRGTDAKAPAATSPSGKKRRRPPPPRKKVPAPLLEVEPDTGVIAADDIDEPLPFVAGEPGKVPSVIARVTALADNPAQGATLAASGKGAGSSSLPFDNPQISGSPSEPSRQSAVRQSAVRQSAADWAAVVTQPIAKTAKKKPPSSSDESAEAGASSRKKARTGEATTSLASTMIARPSEPSTGVTEVDKVGGSTLPFKKQKTSRPQAGAPQGVVANMPSAARWAALLETAEKGETVTVAKGQTRAEALPFAEGQLRAKEEEAREERKAQQVKLNADAEKQRAQDAAEQAQREQAQAQKHEQDKARAAKRASEEKQRFDEGQRLLREKEAKRKAEAQQKKLDEAKQLEDGLYGTFDE